MKYIILTVSTLFIFLGCSTKNVELKEKFNQVIILNNSDGDISDVEISSTTTKRKMQCSFIPKLGQCAYSYKKEINRKNLFSISWKSKGKTYEYKNLSLEEFSSKQKDNFNVVMTLLEDGNYHLLEK